MTIEELQAKRDDILREIEYASKTFGDKSVQYVADKRAALATLDAEIAAIQRSQAGASKSYGTSFVGFRRG